MKSGVFYFYNPQILVPIGKKKTADRSRDPAAGKIRPTI